MDKINDKKLNFDDIMNVICKYYDLEKKDVLTNNRHQELVTARHMFCNMCRTYTTSTTIAIGKYINRDHASVIFGSNKINNLYDVDKITRTDRDFIVESILGKELSPPTYSEITDINWKTETITFTREGEVITDRIKKFLNRTYFNLAIN